MRFSVFLIKGAKRCGLCLADLFTMIWIWNFAAAREMICGGHFSVKGLLFDYRDMTYLSFSMASSAADCTSSS